MEQIIAALDLGTSKTIASVARKDYTGVLSVLHTETLLSKNAIRRGRIYNSVETSEMISKLIRRLKMNNSLPSPIEKIYVGIGGQSLHTELYSVKENVGNRAITRHLLDSLEAKASEYTPEFAENLGPVSCEYYVDGQLTTHPQGTVATVIEAQFQVVIGNPGIKRNLEAVFKGRDVSVAGYFISPLATAEAVLTAEEKESGCALIELGAGITYLSVYKRGSLKHMIAIPLGGLAITKDIRSLNVSDEEAEDLKVKHGSAIARPTDNQTIPVRNGDGRERTIEIQDLNWIIEARVDEICKNVLNQIETSGYSKALDAGIVITGGGALLRDLPEFIRNQTGKEVRLAQANVRKDNVETVLPPADSCIIGLLTLGNENCLKANEIKKPASTTTFSQTPQTPQTPVPPVRTPEPPVERPLKRGLMSKFGDKIGKFTGELFGDDDYETKNDKDNKNTGQ